MKGSFFRNLFFAGSTLPFLVFKQPKLLLSSIPSEQQELDVDTTRVHRKESEIPKFRLFSLNQNRELSQEIAWHLNTTLGKIKILKSYPGAESDIQILENVRGQHVYLISTMSDPINDTLIELLLTISSMRRASAAKITAVIPYYAYARQCDLKSGRRRSLFASDVAALLEAAGVDRIITVNFHKQQLHGFFDIQTIELDASPLCVPHFSKKGLQNLKIIGVDDKIFDKTLIIQKEFKKRGIESDVGLVVKGFNSQLDYIGKDVADSDCLLVDSIIDAGDTLVKVSNHMKKKGARRIFMFATHGLLMGNAVSMIENSYVEDLLLTNTIPLPIEKQSERINTVSIGKLLAEAITLVHTMSTHSARNNATTN